MNFSEHFTKSIENAEKLISKLPARIAERPGMSSRKIRHFLNNICSFDGAKYLNCGICSGSSFWSAVYHNNILATGIDWFRNDTNKSTEKEFWKNLSSVITQEKETLNRTIEIINQDCFTVELKQKYNVFFYDAKHDEESQYRAITYFNKYLEDEFFLLIDDYDNQYVKSGTDRAIRDMQHQVVLYGIGQGQFGDWDPKAIIGLMGFIWLILRKINEKKIKNSLF